MGSGIPICGINLTFAADLFLWVILFETSFTTDYHHHCAGSNFGCILSAPSPWFLPVNGGPLTTHLSIKIHIQASFDVHGVRESETSPAIHRRSKLWLGVQVNIGLNGLPRGRSGEGVVIVKIVFAIKSMDAQGGGAERVLAEIASGLAERGHQITILTFDRPNGHSFYSLHSAIERICVDIGDVKRSAGFFETSRRVVAMRAQVMDLSPDIVVGFMHSMFIPMGLALIGTGIPLVASEHIVSEHYKSRPFQSLLLRMTPLLSRLITVVSQQALETYPAALRAHMQVVPNPICKPSSVRADILGRARRRKKLLVVGRLEAQKDHATLIDAFARIADRVPDWDLRLAGEGSLRGKLEEMVEAHGLGVRVEMPGVIKDISSEYASAQLFVMPSLYESCGLATGEALTHGLPVVGFADCPGTNELIDSGSNGMLVEDGKDRVNSLARALESLMKDPEARIRLVSAKGSLNGPAIESLLDLWSEMLQTTASPRKLASNLFPITERSREISA